MKFVQTSYFGSGYDNKMSSEFEWYLKFNCVEDLQYNEW